MPERHSINLCTFLLTFSTKATIDWERVAKQARAFDQAGFDRLVVPDHVAFGEHLEEYGQPAVGGRTGHVQPTGPDGAWLEPLTALAAIAALTSRIRLGTYIILAALRRPIVFAKVAATLDVISNGRLDLAVGVGWQRDEYEAAGLDFGNRGQLLNHTLEVCQTLWREPHATYQSPELRFKDIHMMPKPVQPGGVPLWVSGTVCGPVVRRVARFATGWAPWGPDDDDIAGGIARMRHALSREGRDPADLRISGILHPVLDEAGTIDIERTVVRAPALVDAGVTDLVLPPVGPQSLEHWRGLVAALRAVIGRSDPLP
jgi:probable F420-dependent oxidoreductase